MAINEADIRKLLLARYLFENAESFALSPHSVSKSASLNLLHDALEAFLVVVAGEVNASTTRRMDFANILDAIDNVISPRALPQRRKLIEINSERVRSKHDGITPNAEDLNDYLQRIRVFFSEVSDHHLKIDFWSLSLINQLDERESKDHLRIAEAALGVNRWTEVLIEVRKAIFLEIEREYDISPYEHIDTPGLLSGFTKAPYYARNKKYFAEKVKDPFDRVILDHNNIDSELVKKGADISEFWNIWRLTPRVYRQSKDTNWLEEYDPQKLEATDIEQTARSVFESAVSLAFTLQRHDRKQRYRHKEQTFEVTFVSSEGKIDVYDKASKSSNVVKTLLHKEIALDVQYRSPSLDDDDYYWRVFHLFPSKEGELPDFLIGYVSESLRKLPN